jgi:hypothetical protein
MTIRNRIEYVFGPYLTFTGIIFIVFGLIFIRQISGIILIVFGAFLALTTNGVLIEPDKNLIKSYSRIFGVVTIGRWQKLSDFSGITIIPFKKTYTVYSRSNRQNTTERRDFRIFLLDRQMKHTFAVKKCDSMAVAQTEIDRLALLLHLPVCIIDNK